MHAITRGTLEGLALLLNIVALLIVLVALVTLANLLLGLLPAVWDAPITLQRILGALMAPLVWLAGIPWSEVYTAGSLMGTKTILNEFVAYISLGNMKAANVIQDPKSLLIATYALCGFANFASIGIQIGGISQLAPTQRRNLTELGVKALIGGTIACLMCGCIAGALFR